MPSSVLERVRKICMALPGAHEVKAWGEPTFRVNNKVFAMFANADNHHGAGHDAVWVNSTHINQEFMIRADPKRFFSPPYAGPSGWIGVKLDGRVSWTMVADVVKDGYELTCTKLPPRQRAALQSDTSRTASPKPKARTIAKAGTKATGPKTTSRRS